MRILLTSWSVLLLISASAEAQFRAPDPVPGENFHVELGLMSWKPTPQITLSTEALQGHDVDFVKELAIEDKNFPEFRAAVKVGRTHKLRVSYVPVRYSKDTFIERTFVYSGRTYNIGLPVNADFTWDFWRFGHEWDFFLRDRGLIGLVTQVEANTMNVGLATPVAGSVEREIKFPVPTLGGIARGYLGRPVSVTLEFTYFKLPDIGDEYKAKVTDFDIYGMVNLGSHLAVQGGYRAFELDYLVKTDSGDLWLKGWYFGGVARF